MAHACPDALACACAAAAVLIAAHDAARIPGRGDQAGAVAALDEMLVFTGDAARAAGSVEAGHVARVIAVRDRTVVPVRADDTADALGIGGGDIRCVEAVTDQAAVFPGDAAHAALGVYAAADAQVLDHAVRVNDTEKTAVASGILRITGRAVDIQPADHMAAAVEEAVEAALRVPAADAGPFIAAEINIRRQEEVRPGICAVSCPSLVRCLGKSGQLCGRLNEIRIAVRSAALPGGIHRAAVPGGIVVAVVRVCNEKDRDGILSKGKHGAFSAHGHSGICPLESYVVHPGLKGKPRQRQPSSAIKYAAVVRIAHGAGNALEGSLCRGQQGCRRFAGRAVISDADFRSGRRSCTRRTVKHDVRCERSILHDLRLGGLYANGDLPIRQRRNRQQEPCQQSDYKQQGLQTRQEPVLVFY